MATQPEGQNCGNCDFWIDSTCRRVIASTFPGGSDASRWTSCPASGWCGFWNVWPSGAVGAVGPQTCTGGTVDPSNSDGDNLDFYVKSTSQDVVTIYQKQAGIWVVIGTV